jgi:nucleoside-diphosphate-sugar epimerase
MIHKVNIMNGTCFVTGGSGFVGRRLIERLKKSGWQVRALARNEEAVRLIERIGATAVRGELDNEDVLASALEGCTIVIHVAALFKLWGTADEFEKSNVHGTSALLNAARNAGVKRFIQVGAAAVVMGKLEDLREANEDLPRQQKSWAPYSASKARSEALVLAANRPGIFETIVIRPPMIWGVGMPMLESVLENVRAGQFRLVDKGAAQISTAHVDNVCHAVELAMTKGRGGDAYFVSDEENRSFRDVLAAFLRTRNVEVPKTSVSLSVAWVMATWMETAWKAFSLKGEPPITRQLLRFIGKDFTLDISKARRELGYHPEVSWSAGLETMK